MGKPPERVLRKLLAYGFNEFYYTVNWNGGRLNFPYVCTLAERNYGFFLSLVACSFVPPTHLPTGFYTDGCDGWWWWATKASVLPIPAGVETQGNWRLKVISPTMGKQLHALASRLSSANAFLNEMITWTTPLNNSSMVVSKIFNLLYLVVCYCEWEIWLTPILWHFS